MTAYTEYIGAQTLVHLNRGNHVETETGQTQAGILPMVPQEADPQPLRTVV